MTKTPASMVPISVDVNGATVTRTLEPRVTLAEFLRNDLGLTGTKISCQMQVCGVCTVLVGSLPVSACTYLAVDAHNREVRTVEGLTAGAELHPLQEAFVDDFALQCGYCTPGFLMMAAALMETPETPSREQIVRQLEGNICRCTGYRPILDAVERVLANRERDTP